MLHKISTICMFVGISGVLYGTLYTNEPKALKWGVWCLCWVVAGTICQLLSKPTSQYR